MMNLFLALVIMVLGATSLIAVEPDYPILLSDKGTLYLKACETGIDCSFVGIQTLSGAYYFGIDEACDNSEKDTCVTLTFYPDNVALLPAFEGWRLKSINITNYRETAQKLMGKTLSDKTISRAKTVVLLPGVGKAKAVEGKATVTITDYNMGICCDSLYANAKVLQVKKKSKGHIVDERQQVGAPDRR